MAERVPLVHDAVVDRVTSDLRPVRRLWPPAARLAVWLAIAAMALAWVLLFHLRPDAGREFADLLFVLQLATFAGAGVLAALLALRAAVPGDDPSRIQVGAALGLAGLGALLLLLEPAHLERPLSAFAAHGAGCAVLTLLLAAAPLVTLAIAVRRGAPFAAARAAAWVGAGALLLAFALMRLACPRDELFHVAVWHGCPVLLGVTLAALSGTLWIHRGGAAR